jgi:hypothetical protein
MARKPAELIFSERINYEDGAIAELKLWRVPPSAHRFKYSYSTAGREFANSDTITSVGRASTLEMLKRLTDLAPSNN